MSAPPLSKARPWQGASGENQTVVGKLLSPAPASTPLSPDILAIASIVSRARRHSPEPKPMVVLRDGSEVEL